MLVSILGGARSGKSSFAERIAVGQEEKYGRQIIYLATAKAKDKEMEKRIERHQNNRPGNWKTIEASINLYQAIKDAELKENPVVILDCLTILLSNYMLEDVNYQLKDVKNELKNLFDYLKKKGATIIVVTNEVGQGVVPANKLGREFRDEAGWLNQWLVKQSDKLYLTIAGMPLEIKSNKIDESSFNPNIYTSEGGGL